MRGISVLINKKGYYSIASLDYFVEDVTCFNGLVDFAFIFVIFGES